jgi:hypothetical protein
MSAQGIEFARGRAGRVLGAGSTQGVPQRRTRRAGDQSAATDPGLPPAQGQTGPQAPRSRSRINITGCLGAAAAGIGAAWVFSVTKNSAQLLTAAAPTPATPGDLSQLPTVIIPRHGRHPNCYPDCLERFMTEGTHAQDVGKVLGKAVVEFQNRFSDVKGNDEFTKPKSVEVEFAQTPRRVIPEWLEEARLRGETGQNVINANSLPVPEREPGAKVQFVPRQILAECSYAADVCMQSQLMHKYLLKIFRQPFHANILDAYKLNIDGRLDLRAALSMAMQMRPGGLKPKYFEEQKGISPAHKIWAVTASGEPASLMQLAQDIAKRFGPGAVRQFSLNKGENAVSDEQYRLIYNYLDDRLHDRWRSAVEVTDDAKVNPAFQIPRVTIFKEAQYVDA